MPLLLVILNGSFGKTGSCCCCSNRRAQTYPHNYHAASPQSGSAGKLRDCAQRWFPVGVSAGIPPTRHSISSHADGTRARLPWKHIIHSLRWREKVWICGLDTLVYYQLYCLIQTPGTGDDKGDLLRPLITLVKANSRTHTKTGLFVFYQ